MRNLIRFIATYRLAFLFILLQFCSFTLLFRSSSYHNALFFHSSQHWIGTLYDWRSSVSQYFRLKKENKRLAEENARLHQKLLRYKKDPDFKIPSLKDSAIEERYQVFQARVINSTVHRRNNHLTMDGGSKMGIERDMGVIGPSGIVGMVRNSSEHFATALSVLNTNFRGSVKLKRNGAIGLLKWQGEGPRTAEMVNVAKHIEVREGDSIVTRGAGAIFPPGIPVGKVKEVHTDPSKNYHRIKVHLFSDLGKVHHVYVIGDRLKEEKEALEKSSDHVQ